MYKLVKVLMNRARALSLIDEIIIEVFNAVPRDYISLPDLDVECARKYRTPLTCGTREPQRVRAQHVVRAKNKPAKIIQVLHVDDEIDQLIISKLVIEKIEPLIQVTSLSKSLEVINRITSWDCIVLDFDIPSVHTCVSNLIKLFSATKVTLNDYLDNYRNPMCVLFCLAV